VNTLVITNNDDSQNDKFEHSLIEWCDNHVSNNDFGIFEVNEEILSSLDESEVNILIF
jgi:hypothetical protein